MQSGKGGEEQIFLIFGDEPLLDILELQMKIKTKVLGVFISSFKTYTRYFGVADEKKKIEKEAVAY